MTNNVKKYYQNIKMRFISKYKIEKSDNTNRL